MLELDKKYRKKKTEKESANANPIAAKTRQNWTMASIHNGAKKLYFFLLVFPFYPMAVPGYSGARGDNLSKFSPGPSHGKMSKSVPVYSVVGFWACPVVPLYRDNEEFSVPLSSRTRKFVPLETLVQMQLQKGLGKLVGVPVQFVYGRVDVVLCVR